jgi:imidazolonepropionase-like amidohydrolase
MVRRHLTEDLALVKKHGVKVAMGSDIVGDDARPHGSNYEEIVEESKFLGNRGALEAATSAAAQCIDLPNTGRIKKGLDADIVVVKGNPLIDIKSLAPENIVYVIRNGRLYTINKN